MRISDWSSDVCSSDLGQVQGDLSNWRPGGHTFTLFRNAADATRGTFYPADIAAMYPASQYTNGVVGSRGGRYVDPNPMGYGEDPQLHLDVSGRAIVWIGFDTPLEGGLGAGHGLAGYMCTIGRVSGGGRMGMSG